MQSPAEDLALEMNENQTTIQKTMEHHGQLQKILKTETRGTTKFEVSVRDRQLNYPYCDTTNKNKTRILGCGRYPKKQGFEQLRHCCSYQWCFDPLTI